MLDSTIDVGQPWPLIGCKRWDLDRGGKGGAMVEPDCHYSQLLRIVAIRREGEQRRIELGTWKN